MFAAVSWMEVDVFKKRDEVAGPSIGIEMAKDFAELMLGDRMARASFSHQFGPGRRTLHTLHKGLRDRKVYRKATVPGSIRRRQQREAVAR